MSTQGVDERMINYIIIIILPSCPSLITTNGTETLRDLYLNDATESSDMQLADSGTEKSPWSATVTSTTTSIVQHWKDPRTASGLVSGGAQWCEEKLSDET